MSEHLEHVIELSAGGSALKKLEAAETKNVARKGHLTKGESDVGGGAGA